MLAFAAGWLTAFGAVAATAPQTEHYVRYQAGAASAYGRLEGGSIQPLSAAPWLGGVPRGAPLSADAVTLLAPVEPSKVIAVGLNYLSHLGEREPDPYPGLFAKFPTSIAAPQADIPYPAEATDLHYEGEMVVVIGRLARHVAVADAGDYVFGVTAGNDVSERGWQATDLQWLRAKGHDGFGPVGPAVVRGLDYQDLLLETRVNGDLKQSQRTRDLIFDVPHVVSYVSRYVTLYPGDVIFTGTPGATSAITPGDMVEVSLEGVGTIHNRVAAPAP